MNIWKDSEYIKRFLASNELSGFATGDMSSSDRAWSDWLQPQYDAERKKWLSRTVPSAPNSQK